MKMYVYTVLRFGSGTLSGTFSPLVVIHTSTPGFVEWVGVDVFVFPARPSISQSARWNRVRSVTVTFLVCKRSTSNLVHIRRVFDFSCNSKSECSASFFQFTTLTLSWMQTFHYSHLILVLPLSFGNRKCISKCRLGNGEHLVLVTSPLLTSLVR